MPTKNPRIHVVLEAPLFERLKKLSIKDGLSMSLEAREIIRRVFKASEKRTIRTYSGKHIASLIGKFRLGHSEPDDILATQVHG